MTLDDYERFLLALTMWREARGEGTEGMAGVGCVVANRVNANWFGGSWVTNITGLNQFSSMSVRGDPQTVAWPQEHDATWLVAMDLATKIHAGAYPDPTHGATYYFNPKTATSKWFLKNVVGKRVEVARIGNHRFYA